jgi:hypothetical protein
MLIEEDWVSIRVHNDEAAGPKAYGKGLGFFERLMVLVGCARLDFAMII